MILLGLDHLGEAYFDDCDKWRAVEDGNSKKMRSEDEGKCMSQGFAANRNTSPDLSYGYLGNSRRSMRCHTSSDAPDDEGQGFDWLLLQVFLRCPKNERGHVPLDVFIESMHTSLEKLRNKPCTTYTQS